MARRVRVTWHKARRRARKGVGQLVEFRSWLKGRAHPPERDATRLVRVDVYEAGGTV